jgi:hypothetical protein
MNVKSRGYNRLVRRAPGSGEGDVMEQKEITLAELAKKIDDQSRFTRSISIICTLIIVGFGIYSLTEEFTSLPSVIVLHYIANLEKIVYEWNAVEANVAKNKANPSGSSAAGK